MDFPVKPGDLKRAYPGPIALRFQTVYPGHSLTTCLAHLINHKNFEDWGRARNVLAHRAQPPRLHSMVLGGSVVTELKLIAGLEIDEQTTATRRLWLAHELSYCMKAAQQFATSEFV